jgi:hypothetical protein
MGREHGYKLTGAAMYLEGRCDKKVWLKFLATVTRTRGLGIFGTSCCAYSTLLRHIGATGNNNAWGLCRAPIRYELVRFMRSGGRNVLWCASAASRCDLRGEGSGAPCLFCSLVTIGGAVGFEEGTEVHDKTHVALSIIVFLQAYA